MQVLFDDLIAVGYHLFWIRSYAEDFDPETGDEWPVDLGLDGQSNGLCGASVKGMLAFTTATRDGDVQVRVEQHDLEPLLSGAWGEVVEASFSPAGPDVHLELWDGPTFPLALAVGDLRARFCISNFERDDAGGSPERCLIQFWPAAPSADRVVRCTSTSAAYWHGAAQRGHDADEPSSTSAVSSESSSGPGNDPTSSSAYGGPLKVESTNGRTIAEIYAEFRRPLTQAEIDAVRERSARESSLSHYYPYEPEDPRTEPPALDDAGSEIPTVHGG